MTDDVDLNTVDERSFTYCLLVDYFIYVDKLSIDDAHRKVDAIYKYLREVG